MKSNLQKNYSYRDTSREFSYTLHRSSRRTVGIRVNPDQSVTVRAPLRLSNIEISKIVSEKATWIGKCLDNFSLQPRPIPEVKYAVGESLLVGGEAYTIEDCPFTASRLRVEVRLCRYTKRIIFLSKMPLGAEEIEQAYYKFLREQLENYLEEHKLKYFHLISNRTKKIPTFNTRIMKSRWGSCGQNGKITLNVQLMKYRSECIDYVLMHETCHLVEFNHGKRFYKLMDELMPNWQDIKKELDQSGK